MKAKMKVPAILMLAALPPDLFEKAIMNAELYPINIFTDVDSLSMAIAESFDWSKTQEGVQYWANIYWFYE